MVNLVMQYTVSFVIIRILNHYGYLIERGVESTQGREKKEAMLEGQRQEGIEEVE